MEKKFLIKSIVGIIALGIFGAGLFAYIASQESGDPELRIELKADESEKKVAVAREEQPLDKPSEAANQDPEANEADPLIDKKIEENKEGPDYSETLERFVVSLSEEKLEQTAQNLADKGFIKDQAEFLVRMKERKIAAVLPGGYKISKEMGVEQIAGILAGKPYMKWVVVPEGLRKEETAGILANYLGWDAVKSEQWIAAYSLEKPEYLEGVYFPETYLIPVDESPAAVAKRFIDKFNEKFEPYLAQFNNQNIKWTTGLTLASIVQREAANAADMPLIARILWNRLEREMPMACDATLQYIRGDEGNGWWAPITAADKQVKSPYNTYLNIGLPPYPICNPGLAAIEAVINPAESDCLYYLHSRDGVTHCAQTYAEHEANIEKYLKTQ